MTAATFRHTKEEKFETKILRIEEENQVITQEEQIREKFRRQRLKKVENSTT